MNTRKRRKTFPFDEHHGNLVYIGGVQRKLRDDEESKLLKVLAYRKLNKIAQQIKKALGCQSPTQRLIDSHNKDKVD